METLYETLKNISQEVRKLKDFGVGACELNISVSEKGFENFHTLLRENHDSYQSPLAPNIEVNVSLSIKHDKSLDK